jgi:micrococcal nuclease
MRSKAFLISPIVLILLLLPSSTWAWQGKVIHVTDGDTIVVLTEDKEQVRIRLFGIDTPESRQPFGSKATRLVRELPPWRMWK